MDNLLKCYIITPYGKEQKYYKMVKFRIYGGNVAYDRLGKIK